MGLVLGIESSCDETAAALVTSDRTILAQRIASQDAEHAPYGGVVPEIAARAHAERLAPMIDAVLKDAGKTLADCDAIAATAGPGLIGGVMVGLVSAKALAMASETPLIAVNHLEGHALSPRLSDPDLGFPYLLLLVSGGHCQILLVEGGYPGGPAVERLAKEGDAANVPLPRPLLGSKEPHFSFAGLKSAVLRAKDAGIHSNADIAASFQQAALDCVLDRLAFSADRIDPVPALVVAGGVAANAAIRAGLEEFAQTRGMRFVAPPPSLCTDNAAMIAWAGCERLALDGFRPDPLDIAAKPRWPLDPDAEPARGAGVKA
jgi:N6-L-threonylcarbamoyladenine synthase